MTTKVSKPPQPLPCVAAAPGTPCSASEPWAAVCSAMLELSVYCALSQPGCRDHRCWGGAMGRLGRWVCAIVGSLGMFALVWWVWFLLDLPPAGPDRLGVALAVAGAVAIAGGAPLAWWAGREVAAPESAPVAAAPVRPSATQLPSEYSATERACQYRWCGQHRSAAIFSFQFRAVRGWRAGSWR